MPPSVASKAFHFTPASRERQSGNVSPALLNSFYHISNNGVQNAGATQSLFESLGNTRTKRSVCVDLFFAGQSYVPADLTQFQQSYNLPQTPIAKVVGVNQPSQCAQSGEKGGSVLLSHFDGILQVNNCFEASLDVQYILAIAQNATTWYWSVSSTGDIFLQWIEALASTPNPPLVHSMSYASLAPEDPKYDVERFNTEMCKLGLKGLTLFVASGDDGVANFGARNSPSQCGFTPSFPATSPVSFCKCLLLLLLTRVPSTRRRWARRRARKPASPRLPARPPPAASSPRAAASAPT